MNKYIHYGQKEFDVNKFNLIKNRMNVKPDGGLWASDVNAKLSWIQWCIDNCFFKNDFNLFFTFSLKADSKVLIIKNVNELDNLPKQSFDTSLFNFGGFTYLDFEKIQKQYDAIEVLILHDYGNCFDGLYGKLYGWDCDSILIMNPDIILCD